MTRSVKKYFEDLAVGDHAESAEQAVNREEMLEFARRYDPQYFHTDPQAAKGSIFGEVVASGLFTTVLWRRLDHQISGNIAWICGVAWKDTRWPKAVRATDRLRARWQCVGKRESGSDPRRGIIEMDYTLINQSGETVFSCRSVNLIERRALV